MANERTGEAGSLPESLDFLMFCSAGVSMAVDASQVAGVVSPGQAGQCGISIGILSEILGMEGVIHPASLKVLLCRDGGDTYGIGVDRLESIVPVPIGAIRLLPAHLLSPAGPRPFWGALPRGKDVVLLVDLYRLRGLGSVPAERP